MSTAFIRGLWGDCEIMKWPKALADIAANFYGKKHPTPTMTYVYGTINYYYTTWLGLRPTPVLVAPEAVCSWGQPGDRNPVQNVSTRQIGQENWGISIWRHKLEIIKLALQKYDQVVWLDWDCWLVADALPDDFWQRMAAGQPLQASMLKFDREKLPWRQGDGAKYLTHGAFIYCRDVNIINELLSLSEEFPTYYDEVLIMVWSERRRGRPWQSGDDQLWIDEGFEPFRGCYRTKRQVQSVRNVLFREGCR